MNITEAADGFVIIDGRFEYGVQPKLPKLAQIKYDGHRMFAIKKNNALHLFSKKGKRLAGFTRLWDALWKLPDNTFVDGELVGFDYQHVCECVRTKDDRDLHFRLFDTMPADDFERGVCENIQIVRSNECKKLVADINDPKILPVAYSVINNMKELLEIFHAARKDGAEGLVLKKMDSYYSFRRDKSWQKVKAAQTVDGIIIGFEMSGDVMKNILVESNQTGKQIFTKLGAGFTKQQRFDCAAGDTWIDKKVEFKADGQHRNKNYRNAVFLRLREED